MVTQSRNFRGACVLLSRVELEPQAQGQTANSKEVWLLSLPPEPGSEICNSAQGHRASVLVLGTEGSLKRATWKQWCALQAGTHPAAPEAAFPLPPA